MSPNSDHSVLTNATNHPRQQPYHMTLQLPENRRLKLQQHERIKFQQQQQGGTGSGQQHHHQSPQGMEPSVTGQLHGSVTPVNGNFSLQQQQPQIHHQQQPQPYYTNPDYQKPSASRPSFAQASSSYQPQSATASHPHQLHGQVQGHSYQYVQVPQQTQTQSSHPSPNTASNPGMTQTHGNPITGHSASNPNHNTNYQMYNMTGLPSSARPSTSSGQQGGEMMNMQPGRIGPFQNQEQAPTMNMDRSRAEVSGSSNGGISDNTTYGEYGMQVSNSTQSNRLPPSVMSAQASSDTSAPGLHPSADMPAFSSMPFEYGSSSSAGPAGTGTVSGYQVGSSSSAGNGMVQSFDQRGQSSVYQDRSNQGPSYYNAGKGQGEQAQSSSVDQESFEFMRRKRWPQLLMQELVGAVVWCLIPYERRMSNVGDYDMDGDDEEGVGGSSGSKKRRPSIKESLLKKPTSGWKVVFASPAISELLGVKPEEAEGRDWADFIHPLDLPRLLSLMQNAVENSASSADISKRGSSSAEDSAQAMTSHNYEVSQTRSSAYEPANMSVPQSGIGGFVGPGGSGTSVVDYVRMVDKMGKEVLFELKGHAHFGDEQDQETSSSPEGNGGFDGGGVMGVGFANGGFGSGSSNRAMSHRRSADEPPEKSVKAFWIMGRKWCSRNDAGGRMLEHFLELKLENERLKQELKDLQSRPFNSKEPLAPRSQAYATASFQPSHVTQIGNFNAAGQPKERTASADNTDDSGQDDDASDDEIPGVLRQPPQNNRVSDLQLMATGEDSKKSKRQKNKNPEYLCRNCGRNDSPEWRKGPLGPKTLCNACGLRWAKKQAGPNNAKRKEKEKDKEVIGGGGSMEGFHAMGVNRMDMP